MTLTKADIGFLLNGSSYKYWVNEYRRDRKIIELVTLDFYLKQIREKKRRNK
jgi:hypothetical protein